MLVQILFFILMLFGVAVLYVDMGIARLTQAQMQNAADTAALEGLRQRDAQGCSPSDSACLAAEDANRRTAACLVAGWTFDDNYSNVDPTTCAPNGADTNPLKLGAGPVVAFTDQGQGALVGLQTYDPSTSGVYQPGLQFNVNNAINGDMVSGTAGGTADVNGNTITATSGSFAALSPPHPIVVNGASFVITAVVDPTHATLNGAPGNATGVPWSTPSPGFPDASCAAVASGPHAEDCQYNRSDFSPNTDLTKSSLAPSFLVRLRRTDHRNDALDRNSNVAPALGVSSSGEPLPFLFARGTFINGADPNNAAVYSPRRDGLTVRATALAGARPALHVGSPATLPGSPPVTGVMPFAFTECFWSTTLSNGTPVSFSVNSSGIITIPTACIDGAGMFYVQPAQTVGNVITSLGMQGSPPVVPGYVPIYDPSLGNLVIGFGFLNTPSGGTPQISKVSSSMAVTNATALVTGGFPVSGATLAAVLLANGRLNGEGALLVPVIAR